MADNPPNSKPKRRAVNVGAQQVAVIYAKALLGAAGTAGKTAEAVEELGAVSAVLDQFPQLEAVFASALIAPEEKSRLLDRLFGSKLSPLVLDALKVIGRHGRLDIVRAVEEQAAKLYDEMSGRVRVQLRTAAPLDDGQSRSMIAALERLFRGQPKLEPEVDPALIGGVLLRVGDTVYDGSVARQLDQVRQQMINRSVHAIQSRRNSFRHSGGD